MIQLVIVALAICQFCAGSPGSSINSVAFSSSYSSNPNDTAVFCGSLNCSEKADTCTVSKISNEDLSKIIITHECKLGDEVLLSVQSEKKNPFKIYVKTVSTSSIRKSTAEDTRRIQDEIQANFAKTYNNIHNKIRDNMLDNFGNAFRNSWRFSGFRPETNLP